MDAPHRIRPPLAPRLAMAVALLAAGAAGARAETVDGAAQQPSTRTLDLSLDVRPFLPAPSTGDASVGARRPAPAPTLASGASAASALPRSARPVRDRREDDGLQLRFNLRGYSVLQMQPDGGASFSLDRIREAELRDPAVSFTLQKKF